LIKALMVALLALGAGLQAGYLTDRDVRLIREYWPQYSYAAKKAGIPVSILPAIHYRESDLHLGWWSKKQQKLIRNIGGPFMLDLGPHDNPPEFDRRIRQHEAKMAALYGYRSGAKVSHDFKFAALVAAHELKGKFRCYGCLADAVWGYNGRAGWHGGNHLRSSYVWSDPKRGHVLEMRYRRKDGTWVTYPDARPGVMVIHAEILRLIHEGVLP
jgi:hypothetical protein